MFIIGFGGFLLNETLNDEIVKNEVILTKLDIRLDINNYVNIIYNLEYTVISNPHISTCMKIFLKHV